MIRPDDPLSVTATPRMTGRLRRAELPVRGIPDASHYYELATHDGRRVFIRRVVLLDLARLERLNHPAESAALIFGRHFSDGEHACTVVTDLVFPEPGEIFGTESTVTITALGAQQMKERAYRLAPCADPVGWAHTHPRFEAFFSGTDRDEQAAWCEPGSIGLVISGLSHPRERYCVFVGPDSTRADPVPVRSSTEDIPGPGGERRAAPERRALRLLPPAATPTARARARVIAVAAVVLAVLALGVSLVALRDARAAHRHSDVAEDQARAALLATNVAYTPMVPIVRRAP